MLTGEQLRRLRRVKPDRRNRLADAIALAETTQVELADAVGIAQPHVSKIARGEYVDLPLETSRRIAEYFGCAIEDLFPAKAEVA